MERMSALDPADAAEAVRLDLFVDAAYRMWRDHPGDHHDGRSEADRRRKF